MASAKSSPCCCLYWFLWNPLGRCWYNWDDNNNQWSCIINCCTVIISGALNVSSKTINFLLATIADNSGASIYSLLVSATDWSNVSISFMLVSATDWCGSSHWYRCDCSCQWCHTWSSGCPLRHIIVIGFSWIGPCHVMMKESKQSALLKTNDLLLHLLLLFFCQTFHRDFFVRHVGSI